MRVRIVGRFFRVGENFSARSDTTHAVRIALCTMRRAQTPYVFRGISIAAPVLMRRIVMPDQTTIARARKDKREGKSPSTQAGEFVREEIEHVREGKHGARSAKQAIAIGLSKARRAGVKLPPPKKGKGFREDADSGGAQLCARADITRTGDITD